MKFYLISNLFSLSSQLINDFMLFQLSIWSVLNCFSLNSSIGIFFEPPSDKKHVRFQFILFASFSPHDVEVVWYWKAVETMACFITPCSLSSDYSFAFSIDKPVKFRGYYTKTAVSTRVERVTTKNWHNSNSMDFSCAAISHLTLAVNVTLR